MSSNAGSLAVALGVGVMGGYFGSQFIGGKIDSDVAALAAQIECWDTATNSWLERKALYQYIESSGARCGVYAYTFTCPDPSVDLSVQNPQIIVAVKVLSSTGAKGLEAALMAVNTVRIYFKGVSICQVTANSTVISLVA